MTTDPSEYRMFDHAERIAALETQCEHMAGQMRETRTSVETLSADLKKTNDSVTGLLKKVEKWEGKFGAFLFIVGCIWTFIASIWNSVIEFFKFKLGA